MICPNCGAQQPDSASFCTECGATVGKAAPSNYGAPPPPSGPAEAYPPTRPAPMAGRGGYSPAGGPGNALTCSNCGAQLEADSAFCDMCGTRMTPSPHPPTKPQGYPGGQYQSPPPPAQSPSPYDYATPPPQARDAYATSPTPGGSPQHAYEPPAPPQPPAINARLVIVESNETLPLPQGKQELIIGRDDPIGGVYPDVDLTDYGGDDAGVSRQHARIYFQGGRAFIEDRGSTNRTYVNGQPLTPWQPHPLRAGDQVRFGRLKTTFYM